MNPVETQLIPARAASELPAGAVSISIGAVVFGVMLVVYAWRQKVLARPAAGPDTRPLAADLSELAERLAAEMEARAGRLESLIAAADARIGRLDAANSHVPVRHEGVHALSGRVRTETFATPEESSHREVYELADRGLSPVDIARKTQRPTGQVELILNLRRGMARL